MVLKVSIPICNFTRQVLPSRSPISLVSRNLPHPVQCKATTEAPNQPIIVRRSANYQPPIWNYDYIQSLGSEYVGESYTEQIDKLKGEVRMIIHKVVDPLEQLELIDILQRLGLSYHFEDEIKTILEVVYSNNQGSETWKKENLYATSLEFRLLRQHGYSVSQEVFNSFKDEVGNFKACLCKDTKGMLCLYEASFLLIEGESILEEARDFTTRHLKEYVNKIKDPHLFATVSHALELPLHWRMPRLEARWFIDVYRSKQDVNPILLELAILDFNIVQATHQEDLKHASRWWKSTGFKEKLSFARDRLIENYLWALGMSSEPQFGYFRRTLTKFVVLTTVVDDIYDVYGTMDELELFTDAIERWDINAMDQLPHYMRIYFLALHNAINEMAYDSLKEQEVHIIPYLKKAWADICRSYLLEAKWYHSGYKPTLQEYIDNAWISVGTPELLVHAYFLVTNPIRKDALDNLEEYPNIIRWSSIVSRLADDLATSSHELERGDVPKSIQCHMNETGASEEDARKHIRYLISEGWKKMNEEQVASSPFSHTFIKAVLDTSRLAQCIYQYGDGFGIGNRETKDNVLSLLIEPIPLPM